MIKRRRMTLGAKIAITVFALIACSTGFGLASLL